MAASNRSTATAAQDQRIVERLRTGPKTTDELREAGCYQVSARLWGLRARGYVINTELFDGLGADGFWHRRMARYALVSEPLPFDAKTQAAACGVPAESRNRTALEPLAPVQLEIQPARSEATA
jgi:hypothetical protein